MKKIILITISLIFIYSCNFDSSIDRDTMSLLAYNYAENALKKNIKSPSTAEFPSVTTKKSHTYEISFTDEDNCEYSIDSYVDSQNGFGAMIRTDFSVTIIIKGGIVSYEDLVIKD